MANSNNWGEIYNSTWWGDEDWSANSLKIDSAPPGFGFTGIGDTVPGAFALYSPDRLISSLTGGAFRVIRSSDDSEQDVTHSADGTVNEVDLLDFVNADVIKADTDFSTSTAGTSETGLGMLVNQSIGGRTGVLQGTIETSSGEHRLLINAVDTGGKSHRLQTSIYIPSGQSGQTVDGFRIENGGAQVYATTTTKDAWVDIDVTFSSSSNSFIFIKFLPSGGAESWTGNGTDNVYIDDVTITQKTADGRVTRIYEQGGNSDLDWVQTDDAKQYKVVDAGSVIKKNGKVIFEGDGLGDNYQLAGGEATVGSTVSIFFANEHDASQQNQHLLNGSTSDNRMQVKDNASDTRFLRLIQGGSNRKFNNNGTAIRGEVRVWSVVSRSSGVTVRMDKAPWGSNPAATGDFKMLTLGVVGTNSNMKNFRELIIYNSDQTDNVATVENDMYTRAGR